MSAMGAWQATLAGVIVARTPALIGTCDRRSSNIKTQNRATRARFTLSIESLSLFGQVDGGEGGIRTHVTA